MAKKTTVRNSKKPKVVLTEEHKAIIQRFQNGLSEALGFNFPLFGAQISQIDTPIKNLRYYTVSNFRNILSQMYVEFGIIQTIVDLPVDDALRGGIEITTKELSPDEINDLQTTMERANDLNTMAQAMKWNRLFGGAGIIILTEQDPKTPLKVKQITEEQRLDFHAVDLWELYYANPNVDDANLIKPFRMDLPSFNYYGVTLDRTRALVMKGITPPSFLRPQMRGWGMSIVECLVRSINQYLKATDLAFEVLDEFKLDVFKLKNMASTLERADGTQLVKQRVTIANQGKNYQNAIVLDAEDDFTQKQISFTGIAEAMAGIRDQIACDMRMPKSKLFGTASSGFSSGEDDIENYNAMIESQIRAKCKYDILRMVELRCQQLFGMIPDDLAINFKPLRMLSSEQEQNVKNAQFNRLLAARQAGELTSKEFKEGCNKEKLLPLQLDVNSESLSETELEDDQERVTPVEVPKSKLEPKKVKS